MFVLNSASSVIFLERETRLELATICLEGRGSSQLSYSRLSVWWWEKDLNLRSRRRRIYNPQDLTTLQSHQNYWYSADLYKMNTEQ